MAQLSRLSLTDNEVTLFTQQLGAILEHASHLPELTDHTVLQSLRTQEDTAEIYPNPGELLQNAIGLEQGAVKVPAILDKSES